MTNLSYQINRANNTIETEHFIKNPRGVLVIRHLQLLPY